MQDFYSTYFALLGEIMGGLGALLFTLVWLAFTALCFVAPFCYLWVTVYDKHFRRDWWKVITSILLGWLVLAPLSIAFIFPLVDKAMVATGW